MPKIKTGPRGGRYYLISGKKVYISKDKKQTGGKMYTRDHSFEDQIVYVDPEGKQYIYDTYEEYQQSELADNFYYYDVDLEQGYLFDTYEEMRDHLIITVNQSLIEPLSKEEIDEINKIDNPDQLFEWFANIGVLLEH
jgi:hypothetical protein